MKFHHIDGVQHEKRRFGWLLPTIALVLCSAGAYILLLVLSPEIGVFETEPLEKVSKTVKESAPDKGDRLYIPKLNIDIGIYEGDENVLEKGAWHRKPQNGNPAEGGNFVLSAHRFEMGWTPQQTRQKSPFYHIERLASDDQIFVDYKGKRYAYKITKRYEVARTAVEIEARSDEPKLTLYSCDVRGQKAGRHVLEAQPQGEVVGSKIVPSGFSGTGTP